MTVERTVEYETTERTRERLVCDGCHTTDDDDEIVSWATVTDETETERAVHYCTDCLASVTGVSVDDVSDDGRSVTVEQVRTPTVWEHAVSVLTAPWVLLYGLFGTERRRGGVYAGLALGFLIPPMAVVALTEPEADCSDGLDHEDLIFLLVACLWTAIGTAILVFTFS